MWLDENIFKGWLAFYSHQENKTLCILHTKSLSDVKLDLIQYSQTSKHIKNIKKSIDPINNNNKLIKFVIKISSNKSKLK